MVGRVLACRWEIRRSLISSRETRAYYRTLTNRYRMRIDARHFYSQSHRCLTSKPKAPNSKLKPMLKISKRRQSLTENTPSLPQLGAWGSTWACLRVTRFGLASGSVYNIHSLDRAERHRDQGCGWPESTKLKVW
jgi:hypothetical protein